MSKTDWYKILSVLAVTMLIKLVADRAASKVVDTCMNAALPWLEKEK